MSHVIALVSLFACASFSTAGTASTTVTFGKRDLGKLPSGWSAAQTGDGKGSLWKVAADDSAPSKSGHVLVQYGKGPTKLFNICVLNQSRFLDGEIEVTYKAVRGDVDQGGGLCWRYQDSNNYYVCRYNPHEENFRVYKVVEGKRIQLATKEALIIPEGWHKLAIRQRGKSIACMLDGKTSLEVEDDAIMAAGKVGLWTKADAETAFDNLIIRKD